MEMEWLLIFAETVAKAKVVLQNINKHAVHATCPVESRPLRTTRGEIQQGNAIAKTTHNPPTVVGGCVEAWSSG